MGRWGPWKAHSVVVASGRRPEKQDGWCSKFRAESTPKDQRRAMSQLEDSQAKGADSPFLSLSCPVQACSKLDACRPATLGRAVCLPDSPTPFSAHLARKQPHPHTWSDVAPHGRAPCGPVELTQKIPHRKSTPRLLGLHRHHRKPRSIPSPEDSNGDITQLSRAQPEHTDPPPEGQVGSWGDVCSSSPPDTSAL